MSDEAASSTSNCLEPNEEPNSGEKTDEKPEETPKIEATSETSESALENTIIDEDTAQIAQKTDHVHETDNAESTGEKADSPETDEPVDPMTNSTHSTTSELNSNSAGTTATISESSYEQELARLRELVSLKETENSNLEQKLVDYEQQAKAQVEQLHQNFTLKLEQTLKKFQDSQKDKTSSMVMKYADAEKRCIDLNQKISLLQSKLSDSTKEKLHLSERLAKYKLEMDKLNADYDQRVKEILQLKKDNEKLREKLVLNDAKEKTDFIKYKNEVELHNNTKRLLEQATQKSAELTAKIVELQSENTGEPLQVEIPGTSDVQVNVVSTESEVLTEPDSQTAAISPSISPTPLTQTQTGRTVEKDRTVRELYALKSQLKDMFEERTTLRDKLQCMDQERKIQEISFNRYKETLQSQKQMTKELLNEILQLRELQETLTK